MSDDERFKDVDPFLVRCRSCQGEVAFAPIGDRESSLLLASGPTCPACQARIGTASLQVQLEVQIREHINKYYEHWTVCNDQTCGNRTRSMGVYGRRCLRPGCRGTVTFEVSLYVLLASATAHSAPKYSDAMLYNQLRYYSYLFDGEKAGKSAAKTSKFA